MIFELMRLLSFIAVLVLLPFATPHASAQAYPTKPVRMIVPWAPGGTTDILGRVIAQKMGEKWGQPVLVENRGGAAGNIGGEAAVRSPADGYTLLLGTMSSHASAQAYPTKPVRMIVPWAPGGTTDILGRVIAQKMGEKWGQPVLVENRGGAAGNIGGEAAVRSPADGYTLLLGTMSSHAMNQF